MQRLRASGRLHRPPRTTCLRRTLYQRFFGANGRKRFCPAQWAERYLGVVGDIFPNRKALVTTDTELRLIAKAAIIGLSSKPNTG